METSKIKKLLISHLKDVLGVGYFSFEQKSYVIEAIKLLKQKNDSKKWTKTAKLLIICNLEYELEMGFYTKEQQQDLKEMIKFVKSIKIGGKNGK